VSNVSERLNGWKEIAAFLGKGVRTVQRWEHDYGLPIHRVGPDGEIIFAYRPEIDAWVRAGMGRANTSSESTATAEPLVPSIEPASAPAAALESGAAIDARDVVDVEPARAAPATRHWGGVSTRAPVIGVAVVLAAVALVGYWRGSYASSGDGPASWVVNDRTLSVTNTAGHTLWSHQFPVELSLLQRTGNDGTLGERPVLVKDVSGDGRNEVLVSLRSDERRDESALYAFNADGSLRFRYAPSMSRVFGGETFAGPWLPYKLFVLTDTDGQPGIWAVFIHGMWYPSVLVQLSSEGRVLSEYWSAGYIERVGLATWRGRPVVLIGGTHNESRGASVAIFPREAVTGVSPGENPTYRCLSCPAGRPTEFLVFPRRCISTRHNTQATVHDLWRDDLDRLHVLVSEDLPPPANRGASAWYVLGADLAVTAAYAPSFETLHREFERIGTLDHPFGPADEASLFPVRRWSRGRFEPLPTPVRTN
jgi:hypothetical protein